MINDFRTSEEEANNKRRKLGSQNKVRFGKQLGFERSE